MKFKLPTFNWVPVLNKLNDENNARPAVIIDSEHATYVFKYHNMATYIDTYIWFFVSLFKTAGNSHSMACLECSCMPRAADTKHNKMTNECFDKCTAFFIQSTLWSMFQWMSIWYWWVRNIKGVRSCMKACKFCSWRTFMA